MKLDSKARKIFKGFPQEVKDYFYQVDKKCQKHGIVFRVGGGNNVNAGGGRCGGYFCDKAKELAVCIGRSMKSGLEILIHEDCHMDQWLDKKSIWYAENIQSGHLRFFSWLLEKKEIRNPTETAKKVILLEADCEKRSLRKIKKRWSHLISPEEYAKCANAYMFSYLWMARSRKWVGEYLNRKTFIRHFPDKLKNKYENLPDQFLLLFSKHEQKQC